MALIQFVEVSFYVNYRLWGQNCVLLLRLHSQTLRMLQFLVAAPLIALSPSGKVVSKDCARIKAVSN